MNKTVRVRVLCGTLPFHPSSATAPGGKTLVAQQGDEVDVTYNGDIRRRIRAGDLAIVTPTKENQPAAAKAKE